MRVLEAEVVRSYTMGKNKKHKLRKSKENDLGGSESSGEGGGSGCPHINKSANFAAMRKAIQKQQTFGECTSCCKEACRAKKPEGAGCLSLTEDCLLDLVEPTLWVCLQCGHQGCDRNSRERHAVKHYESPRSSCHCLVINTSTWSAWCYECDDEVSMERCKRLQECREFLKKCAGVPTIEPQYGRKNSLTDVASGTEQGSKETKSRPLTPKSSTGGCQKVKGLSNLGNTCFFNAVMQNLAQTHCLENTLIEKTKKGQGVMVPGRYLTSDSDSSISSGEDSDDDSLFKELPSIDIVVSESGPLTQSMLGFLLEMNCPTSRNSTINPSVLFGQVCKKAPRFKGFQQQDSHELLRYLLDVMRTEEVKRSQTGILKHFKLPENVNPKKVDEDTKAKIKAYGRLVKRTFLDSVFGGQLMSTVACEECKYISQIFEPFLDLSLPVTEEKPQRPNLILGGRKKDSVSSDVTDVGSPKGVEGFAFQPDKLQDRKQKKQAKKEARKKAKQALKNTSSMESTSIENEDTAKPGDYNKEIGEGERDEGSEEKDGDENDDPSDADVEDNLESDTSRCNKFALLATDSDLAIIETSTELDTCHTRQETVIENCDSQQMRVDTETLPSESISKMQSTVTSSADSVDSFVTVVLRSEDSPEVEDKAMSMSENSVNSKAETDDYMNDNCGGCHVTYMATIENSDQVDELKKNVEILGLQTNGYYDDLDEQKIDGNLGDSMHRKSLFDKDRISIENPVNNVELNNVKNTQSSTHNRCSCSNFSHSDNTFSSNVHQNLCRQTSKQHSKSRKELQKEVQLKSIMTLGQRYQPSSRECSIMSCLHQFTSAELLMGSNKFGCTSCSKQKHKQNPNKGRGLYKIVQMKLPACKYASIPNKTRDKKETVYASASKQYLIFAPPAVLTLHLKRFEQVGFSSRKVNRHVDFPLLLDLAPYCSSLCQGIRPGQKKILYSLYGVVEHSGRLNAGHYTAYVKVRPNIGLLNSFLQIGEVTPLDHLRKYIDKNFYWESGVEAEAADEGEEAIVAPGRWFHISDNRVSEVTETTVQHAQAYLLFYERIY